MASSTVNGVGVCAVAFVIGAWPLAAADLAQYRGFRLESSTTAVMDVSGATSPHDLKTVVARPALLQELEWRPPSACVRVAQTRDPVRRVVFSFVDDRLRKIVAEYDRSRTEGLSRADMIEALEASYGPHDRFASAEGERGGADELAGAAVIARWRTPQTVVTLQRYDYVGGYALVVASVRLEQYARQAEAAGALLDARGARAGDAGLLRIRTDAAREAEKTRLANKASFTP
jgi:hypothetical protein